MFLQRTPIPVSHPTPFLLIPLLLSTSPPSPPPRFLFIQATKILAGFQTLIPNVATVIRDGESLHISATELVVGDVTVLEQGSRVPADIRVIVSHGLKVDKSMLTGESKPAKITSEPDKTADSTMLRAANICFMGCTVVEGEGRGIVIATGADNQLAKIAAQASDGTSSFVTPSLTHPLLTQPITHPLEHAF